MARHQVHISLKQWTSSTFVGTVNLKSKEKMFFSNMFSAILVARFDDQDF
jgi:hypothetical protein